jgi:hypothetical protein
VQRPAAYGISTVLPLLTRAGDPVSGVIVPAPSVAISTL